MATTLLVTDLPCCRASRSAIMAPVGSVRWVLVLPEFEVMPVQNDLVHDIQCSESVRDQHGCPLHRGVSRSRDGASAVAGSSRETAGGRTAGRPRGHRPSRTEAT